MDPERLRQFFNELRPRHEMAREMDARLNRQLALRFNVLDYIRTSELGLSRVIADLLDPQATHGQGVLFLKTLLRGLQRSSQKMGRPLDLTLNYGTQWTVAENTVRVEVERTISDHRRLDISVQFKGSDDRPRCLAIENKPYAGDQKNQIRDYLDFMEREYGDQRPTNHLLIYLSRTGELPSEWSVEKTRLDREIKECDFAVMGFWVHGASDLAQEEDDLAESRLLLDYSLAMWFKACRKECDVERLRNFLRDAEDFCKHHFGGIATHDTVYERTSRFLTTNAEMAQQIAAAVSERKARIKTLVFDEVREHLGAFDAVPEWVLKVHGKRRDPDRLRLAGVNRSHWPQTGNFGVWFLWADGRWWFDQGLNTCGVVGVEWTDDARALFSQDQLRACFPTDANKATVGGSFDAVKARQGGGWFARCPLGTEWLGWDKLLTKSDAEIRKFASVVADLMGRLVAEIDRGEAKRAGGSAT